MVNARQSIEVSHSRKLKSIAMILRPRAAHAQTAQANNEPSDVVHGSMDIQRNRMRSFFVYYTVSDKYVKHVFANGPEEAKDKALAVIKKLGTDEIKITRVYETDAYT